jgi:hypothetical protein
MTRAARVKIEGVTGGGPRVGIQPRNNREASPLQP